MREFPLLQQLKERAYGSEWLTVAEASRLFHVSETTLRRYVAKTLLSRGHVEFKGREVLVVNSVELAGLFAIREGVKQKACTPEVRVRFAEIGIAALSGATGGIAGQLVSEVIRVLQTTEFPNVFWSDAALISVPERDQLILEIYSLCPEVV